MTCTDNKVLVNVAPVAAADKVIIPEKRMCMSVIRKGLPWCTSM